MNQKDHPSEAFGSTLWLLGDHCGGAHHLVLYGDTVDRAVSAQSDVETKRM